MHARSSKANRGQAFEELINFTNAQYKSKRIALINKRPTPIKVIRSSGNVINGVFEKKSTVDYDGVYKGKPICFEAKSTNERERFYLSKIEQHQIEYLEQAAANGAICFLLIEFKVFDEVFFVPFTTIRQYLLQAQSGGKKSIPREDFEYYAYLVEKTKRAPLDYLLHVDTMIGCKPT